MMKSRLILMGLVIMTMFYIHCIKIENIYSPGEEWVYGSAGWKLLDVVDQYGSVNAGAVYGTNLLLATSRGIMIYNNSNPRNIQYVTTYRPLKSSFTKIEIVDNLAYLADSGNGYLNMINIENPLDPISVGIVNFGESVSEIEADDGYAYCSYEDQIWISDISDPNNPVAVNYPIPGYSLPIEGIEAAKDHLFLATSSGLRILTNTVPAEARYIRTVSGSGNETDVAIQGDYAYALARNGYLHIVNIQNPATASITGSLAIAGTPVSVAVSDYVLIAAGTNGLHIVDVSTPSSPSLIKTVVSTNSSRFPFDAMHVCVDGNYAYVSGGSGGFQVVDISTPSAAEIVETIDFMGNGTGVFDVADGYGFVCSTNGLSVFDMNDPVSSSQVGALSLAGQFNDITIWNDFAFIAGSDGLNVIDIHQPQSPVRLSRINIGDNSGLQDPVDVYLTKAVINSITNRIAFVAAEQFGIRVFRVSNPSNTAALYTITTAEDNAVYSMDQAACFKDNIIYVADWDAGIKAIDWIGVYNSQSESQYVITNILTYGWANDVEISEDLLLVATTEGLEMINISDPSNMVLMSPLADLPEIREINLFEDQAYLCSDMGVHIIDLSDTNRIRQKGIVGTEGPALDVVVETEKTYVSENGLHIYSK